MQKRCSILKVVMSCQAFLLVRDKAVMPVGCVGGQRVGPGSVLVSSKVSRMVVTVKPMF